MPEQFYIGIKGLVYNSKGEILIVRKIPPGDAKFEPYWEIPGGRMERETVQQTFEREINEELGIGALERQELYAVAVANFKINHDKDNLFFVIFSCRMSDGIELKLSDEHDQFKWIKPSEVPRYLAYMLPKELLGKISKERFNSKQN